MVPIFASVIRGVSNPRRLGATAVEAVFLLEEKQTIGKNIISREMVLL